MKTSFNKALLVVILGMTSLSSCQNDDPDGPSIVEEAFEKLSGAWDIATNGQILLDGQDVRLNYEGFSLSFSDGTYQTTNAAELFDASGTWQWADELARQILLDDGKTITIIELTETVFQFSFTFSGAGGVANSVDGVGGNYEITVSK